MHIHTNLITKIRFIIEKLYTQARLTCPVDPGVIDLKLFKQTWVNQSYLNG